MEESELCRRRPNADPPDAVTRARRNIASKARGVGVGGSDAASSNWKSIEQPRSQPSITQIVDGTPTKVHSAPFVASIMLR